MAIQRDVRIVRGVDGHERFGQYDARQPRRAHLEVGDELALGRIAGCPGRREEDGTTLEFYICVSLGDGLALGW